MQINTKVEFGWQVKDAITGFSGTVTGFCSYISGCSQVLVAPPLKDDGTPREAVWFDEQRCRRIGDTQLVLDNGDTPGFDKPAPVR